MKLIREFVDYQDIKILKEDSGVGCKGCSSSKKYFIEGPFLQAEVENKNKRKYKLNTIIREVKKYNEEMIKTNRAVGELAHPSGPEINLDRVSHKIIALDMDGSIGYGKAKIIDTPMGRILKTMIDEDIVFGVSTRALGTVNEAGWVNEDLNLICVDVVQNPSAPKALVDGIVEGKEYIMEGNRYIEVAIDEMKTKLDKQGSKVALEALNEFLSKIGTN